MMLYEQDCACSNREETKLDVLRKTLATGEQQRPGQGRDGENFMDEMIG